MKLQTLEHRISCWRLKHTGSASVT